MCERYNGWTNYETWAVKLWMGNEEPSYRYWQEKVQECDDEEHARTLLADALKDEHEEALPDLGASFASDLLRAAFSNVDWYEIAESLLEDAAEEARYEASRR